LRFFQDIKDGLQADWPIIAASLLLWGVSMLVLAAKEVLVMSPAPYLYNLMIFGSVLSFFLIPVVAVRLWRERPDSPIAYIAGQLLNTDGGRRLVRGLPLLLGLIPFLIAFSMMKSSIGLFNTFGWDRAFIAWDSQIHGQDAWLLLQPFMGYPIITALTAAVYHAWLMLLYGSCVYFALFCTKVEPRRRFFIAFLGIWTIIGVVLATVFASYGPAFVEPLLGIDKFNDQMAYLQSANETYPILVLEVQKALLEWHLTGNQGLGRGISAMPSMHVALAFLFYLAMRNISKVMSVAAGIFCVLILLGSVHLAYHYAVDGYVSIAATLIIWKVAGWLAGFKSAAMQPSPEPTGASLRRDIAKPKV
jgi:hypothetical protein